MYKDILCVCICVCVCTMHNWKRDRHSQAITSLPKENKNEEKDESQGQSKPILITPEWVGQVDD